MMGRLYAHCNLNYEGFFLSSFPKALDEMSVPSRT
jgi:hypothetical protein